MGYRPVDPPSAPTAVLDRWAGLVGGLTRRFREFDAESVQLRFDTDAQDDLRALNAEIEARFRPGGDFEHWRDWPSKLLGLVVRLASQLHLASHPEDGDRRAIARETLSDAIDIGEWALEHARAAYRMMAPGPDLAGPQVILRALARIGNPTITERQLFRAVASTLIPTMDDFRPMLETVERYGWVRPAPDPEIHRAKSGRPGSRTFDVHPNLRNGLTELTEPRESDINPGSVSSVSRIREADAVEEEVTL